MSELIGRFLSFEEHLGRGLVKFVYYVLLFLLVVTTLYELGSAIGSMFGGKFWGGLWQFIAVLPLRFFIALLLLRVGTELIIAVLSIDDNLRGEAGSTDTMSTGLNPVVAPKAAPTMKTASSAAATEAPASETTESLEEDEASDDEPKA